MIIPSIDFLGGVPVQLRGGNPKDKLFDNLGYPASLFKKFQVAGRIALVDLDAALGNPSQGNEKIIADLLKNNSHCEVIVGGGIRTVERAHHWLNLGASKVVIGTAATPEFLSQLPKDRVIVALDSKNGEVVVKGWTEGTGKPLLEKIEELRNYTSGFLFTFVEVEGRLTGIPEDRVLEIVKHVVGHNLEIIVAGGAKTASEIGKFDKTKVHVQVGLALHTGDIDLGEAIAACVESSERLIPTVVADEDDRVLGFVYSTEHSIKLAVQLLKGVYHSRRRGIWIKGEGSGNTQELLRISLDCDRDAIKFVVRQSGVFCHCGTRSCFDHNSVSSQFSIGDWTKKVYLSAISNGYTSRLMNDEALLHGKIQEETKELIQTQEAHQAIEEFLDVLYFSLIKVFSVGGTWAGIIQALKLRAGWISHRQGKPPRSN